MEDPHSLLDLVFFSGCNAFDCAAIYGGGACEKILGQWIASRDIPREQLYIVTKGGAGPQSELWAADLKEDRLRDELNKSLERLQCKHVDCYMLHRDDVKKPIKEIVSLMNEFITEGKIISWGVSNWTTKRIQAAIDYASHQGLVAPCVDSPQFSLATPTRSVWPGTSYMSPSRLQWYTPEKNVNIFCWEVLAKGFMAGRWDTTKICEEKKPLDKKAILNQLSEDPDKWRQENLENAYLTKENHGRLERAKKLAEEFDVEVCVIAIAYILAKHPNTFALAGTTSVKNWNKNVQAASIHLTPAQVRFLEGGKSAPQALAEPLQTVDLIWVCLFLLQISGIYSIYDIASYPGLSEQLQMLGVFMAFNGSILLNYGQKSSKCIAYMVLGFLIGYVSLQQWPLFKTSAKVGVTLSLFLAEFSSYNNFSVSKKIF